MADVAASSSAASGPCPAGASHGQAEIWAPSLDNRASGPDAKESPPLLSVLPPKVGPVGPARAPPTWLNLEDPNGDLIGPPPPLPPKLPEASEVASKAGQPLAASATADGEIQWAPAWAKHTATGVHGEVKHLYDYSTRDVWYSRNIPVPERNPGIVINSEFPTHPSQQRRVLHHYDEAIRNVTWRHGLATRMPVASQVQMPMSQWLQTTAGYEGAVDLKGMHVSSLQDRPHYKRERHLPDYGMLLRNRKDEGWVALADKVRHSLEREILTAAETEDFFANEEAVMYERVDYWNQQ